MFNNEHLNKSTSNNSYTTVRKKKKDDNNNNTTLTLAQTVFILEIIYSLCRFRIRYRRFVYYGITLKLYSLRDTDFCSESRMNDFYVYPGSKKAFPTPLPTINGVG